VASTDYDPSTLAQRIREAHAARRDEAHEGYADALAASDLERAAIYIDTVRRYTDGVEPKWLIRAKLLHDELGRYIYVLTQRHRMDLPDWAMQHAEQAVRAFVENSGQVTPGRADAITFLAVVNLVTARDPSVAQLLDAGQPPAEVVCFVYSVVHDVEIAVRLAQALDDVALLLERWSDTSPRRPTKWTVVARLWERATGMRYGTDTWRRWDPRKKQVLPRRHKGSR
jgi:hypothetical protein